VSGVEVLDRPSAALAHEPLRAHQSVQRIIARTPRNTWTGP
jgi:hypothetical protein